MIKWSDEDAWGGDVPPRDGDIVIVNKGSVLLVDVEKTANLYSIVVEGMLLFSDQLDIELNSNWILINRGTL